MNILFFIISLSFLVLVHEFGHFIVAKKSGVGVEEFGIGFPPALFKFKKNGTIYSFNLLLLGGFVRLAGEDDPNVKNGFLSQPVRKKILITIAGIVMNFLLVYFLFSFGYLVGLPDYSPKVANVTILEVLSNSPAAQAGLNLGDRLVELKTKTKTIALTDPNTVRNLFSRYAGEPVNFLVRRGDQTFWRTITPQKTNSPNNGPLGILVGSLTIIKKSFPANFYYGWVRTVDITRNFITVLGSFLANLFEKGKGLNQVVGPIGIFDLYNQMRLLGLGYLFQFWALISLNLVLINIIPFPALDGWRLATYCYEGLTKRRVSARVDTIANQVGFVLLILLFVAVTIKDIIQLK